MMKKICYGMAALLLLMAIALLYPCSACAEAPSKLTLMVYMCGSNLESGYGSASTDIEEMLASGFDSEQVSLLVMTGGTEDWSHGLGFDPANLTINEISRRGIRAVWREEAASMGVPETLTTLLNFGVERFPAEDYALILWNHGGGPMEGVCWDELFSMDNLSPSELTQALDASNLPGKLSWIGFDACLMSSAEVASTLSPYADYMIASQETEPAPGWNYAFLKGIENDADARDTGRRIVDAYFDGMAGIRDTVTLACTDLSRISDVTSAMDSFFKPVMDSLNEDSFASLSGLRMAATSFGRSVRGVGDDSYDLVDLRDLVQKYAGNPELAEKAETLIAALSEAVVYCRSSEAGACGLSVYHPYANKEKYLDRWRDDYQSLDFSAEYRSYSNRFGSLLTERAFADWSDLSIAAESDGVFSLRLTPEQTAEFASAQLLVLRDLSAYADEPVFAPVYTAEAVMQENGLITARYNDRSLFVTDSQGAPFAGPLSLLRDDITGRFSTEVYYWNDHQGRSNRYLKVIYPFDEPDNDSGMVDLYSPRVWDNASQTYTNRIAFNEEDFALIGFMHNLRIKPDGEGTLPGFDDWAVHKTASVWTQLTLPLEWRLRFIDSQLTGTPLHATFQVTDLQQNTYCTPLLPIENDNLNAIGISPALFENDVLRLEISANLNTSALDPGLVLNCLVTNLTDREIWIQSGNIVLNDRRITEGTFDVNLSPGQTHQIATNLSGSTLMDLEAVTSVAFTVEAEETEHYDVISELQVRTELKDFGAEELSIAGRLDPDMESFRSNTVATDHGSFQLAVQMYDEGLKLVVCAMNTAETDLRYTIPDFRFNRRDISWWCDLGRIPPNYEAMDALILRRGEKELFDLGIITSVDCTLEITDPETYEQVENIPLHFEFDGFDISGLAPTNLHPMGEAESDGIYWQLLSLDEGDDGGLLGVVRIENKREDTFWTDAFYFAAEGITLFGNSVTSLQDILPGTDHIQTFSTSVYDSRQITSGLGYSQSEYNIDFNDYLPIDRLLARHGIHEITRVSFTPSNPAVGTAALELNAPFQLEEPEEELSMPESATILEGAIHGEVYAVALGMDGIALSVEFANDTDCDRKISLQNPVVDGQALEFVYSHGTYGSDGFPEHYNLSFLIPANTSLGTALSIPTVYVFDGNMPVHELSFEVECEGAVTTVSIGLDGMIGSEDGVLLTAESLRATPGRLETE